MSEELAKREDMELQPWSGDIEGVDGLEREDFKLPIIRIVQATSRNAPPNSAGKFHNSVTGDVKDYMIVTVLKVAKTRILFPPEFSADSELLCASDDSKTAREQFIGKTITDFNDYPMYVIPSDCDSCVLQDWGPNREPPACALSYQYIVVDLESGMPGILGLKRTDVSMGRALNTLLATPGLKKIRLSSEFVEKDVGQWWALRYQLMPGLTDEDFEIARSMAGIASSAVVSADVLAEDMTPTGEQPTTTAPPSFEETPF